MAVICLELSLAEFVWDVFCVCEHSGETGFKQLVVRNVKLHLHIETRHVSACVFLCQVAVWMQLQFCVQ
jgi:hypothetical protein